LIRRYELLGRLGNGGFGSVWRAYDRLLEREVALKELIPLHEGIDNLAKSRERARHEARVLARLEHPAIVSIHDLISVDDDPWIVMGYFRGLPLEDKIKASQPMSDQEVARFGLPVLNGLMFAHSAGVVHRDVKPLNILIAPDSTVCLVDFGIAKSVGAATTGMLLLGTLEYMAPERLEGTSGEEPSDLWSLGVTFYYAMTKRSPFNRGNVAATTTAILRDDPPPPGRGGPLADMVMQMLRKSPGRRPTGPQVAEVLRAALANGHSHTPQQGTPGPGLPAEDAATVVRPRPSWEPAPPSEDMTAILRMSPQEAITALLSPAPAEAAKIIGHCSQGYAGTLIAGIAATHPQRAGRILESLEPERAGGILSRMNHRAASQALATMRPAEAAKRLSEADTMPAGNTLAGLPDLEAGQIVVAMDEARACRVLSRIDPGKCAAILATLPEGPRARILSQLPSSFRRLVRRHELSPAPVITQGPSRLP
jgi:flagellar motility protein MotE (MotC chaperone)